VLRNLSAWYVPRSGGAVEPEPRLREVDWELDEGALCAVLGANGAGKSTLLRVLAAALTTTSGRVELFGEDLQTMPRALRARQVALVPQHSEVALGFTVGDVVAMGRAPHQGPMMRMQPHDREAVEQALEACGLEELRTRPVSQLSGGEQKRVHIARALAQEPRLLLLDEATAHLDLRHASTICGLVAALVRDRGLTCVMAMHDLNAAARYADRVLVLGHGRVVAVGTPAEVMTGEVLGEAFGVELEIGELPHGNRYFLAR
jgi:iron complex transport system ATP-binding protein